MSPKSASSSLIFRSSVARIAPSAIGISYVCPVRLSVTDRLPVDIGPPPVAGGCADRPLGDGGAHRQRPVSALPGTTYSAAPCLAAVQAGDRSGALRDSALAVRVRADAPVTGVRC